MSDNKQQIVVLKRQWRGLGQDIARETASVGTACNGATKDRHLAARARLERRRKQVWHEIDRLAGLTKA